MTDWDPYRRAFERLVQKDNDQLKEYIFLRFTGREADPEYNWPRNQEPPESFLIWANSTGDESFRNRLAQCIGTMSRSHLSSFINGTEGEELISSRLLYLGEIIQTESVGYVLQDILIREAKLHMAFAQRLLMADAIPWGDSLLHQALGALSTLEQEMQPGDRRARAPFWRPLVEGQFDNRHGFPPSLRIVALRALGYIGWEVALRDRLPYVLDVFATSLETGRSKASVARELANLIYFFIEESNRQEASKLYRSHFTILEDPTPLADGFADFATNAPLLAALEDALRILCRSSKVFGGDDRWRSEWENEFLPQTMDAIKFPSGVSVRKVVEMKRLAAKYMTKQSPLDFGEFNEILGELRTVMNSPPPGSAHAGTCA